jgi:hypothetical protein
MSDPKSYVDWMAELRFWLGAVYCVLESSQGQNTWAQKVTESVVNDFLPFITFRHIHALIKKHSILAWWKLARSDQCSGDSSCIALYIDHPCKSSLLILSVAAQNTGTVRHPSRSALLEATAPDNSAYLNQQKHLFLPIIAYTLSSKKLEIRAK